MRVLLLCCRISFRSCRCTTTTWLSLPGVSCVCAFACVLFLLASLLFPFHNIMQKNINTITKQQQHQQQHTHIHTQVQKIPMMVLLWCTCSTTRATNHFLHTKLLDLCFRVISSCKEQRSQTVHVPCCVLCVFHVVVAVVVVVDAAGIVAGVRLCPICCLFVVRARAFLSDSTFIRLSCSM